jgi:2-polyprenyl-3-methyl-5-hydroxy-6-metoxy-1,4-benzoquinol methylase
LANITPKQFDRVYPELLRKWKHIGNEIYQKPGMRLYNALNVINQSTRCTNLNVLDIGCNSGVLSVALSNQFGYATGIDKGSVVIKQSQFTKSYYQKTNCRFRCITLEEYITGNQIFYDGITALFACQVLYHLDDFEIDLLSSVMPMMQACIFGARPNKNKSNNRFGLYNVRSIKEFLSEYYNIVNVYYEGTKHPIVTGCNSELFE